MKQHIHHKEIKAWADGAEIEFLHRSTGVWEIIEAPIWFLETHYRIKPPEPEWMPKEDDWILAWDSNGEVNAKPALFYSYTNLAGRSKWNCERGFHKHAKPFPLQVERDRYHKALEKIEVLAEMNSHAQCIAKAALKGVP